MSFIDTVIGKIAPHDCLGCGTEGSLLCTDCIQKLPPAAEQPHKPAHLGIVQSVTNYQGMAKDLVWKLKSSGAQSAAKIMAAQMSRLLGPRKPGLIVPVPTATSRVRGRGYDQAKLLARELARQAGLPYADCLARHGQAHQVGASRAQRLQQIAGNFRVTKRYLVRGAHLILVDDVATTGATLETAAVALVAVGAATVEAITFAQA